MSFGVLDEFVLHMFLDRFISGELGNQSLRALETFAYVLGAVSGFDPGSVDYARDLCGIVRRGIGLLTTFRDLDLPDVRDPRKYDFYREHARSSLPATPESCFLFPGGYRNGDSGHMIALLFERVEHHQFRVTYANTGNGIRLAEYHHRQGPSFFEIFVSRVVDEDRAADMLAHLLYQVNPRTRLDPAGEEERSGFAIFHSVLPFYEKVVGPRPAADRLGRDDFDQVIVENERGPHGNGGVLAAERRVFVRRGGGQRVYFGRPQIAGTCTFNSVMWICFYYVTVVRRQPPAVAESVEKKMRAHVLGRIRPPATSEERVCYRLLHVTCDKDDTVLGKQLPEAPASAPAELNTVFPYTRTEKFMVRRGPDLVAAAMRYFGILHRHECPGDEAVRHLREGIHEILLDLRTLLQHVPEPDRLGECGTHYSTLLLNLAQSAVLGAMEDVCRASDRIVGALDAADRAWREECMVGLAESALLVFPLLEGKDRARLVARRWTQAYHLRYRRAVFGLALLAVRIHGRMDPEGQVEARADNSVHVPASHFYDEARSGEEVALVMPFVHCAWAVAQESPYWKEYRPLHGRAGVGGMVVTEETAGAKRAANLKNLVEARPAGYALVVLMTLLSVRRLEGDSVHYRKFHPSIRSRWLEFKESGAVFLHLEDNPLGPELNMMRTQAPVVPAPSPPFPSGLQLAMEDAYLAMGAAHPNGAVADTGPLVRLLLADLSTARAQLGADASSMLARDGRINHHAGSGRVWSRLRGRLVRHLAPFVPTMHDTCLVYFLVHLADMSASDSPISRLGRLFSDHGPNNEIVSRSDMGRTARRLGRVLAGARPDPDDLRDLLAYVTRHQSVMHLFGDSKVPWGQVCVDPDPDQEGPGPLAHVREWVLCRLILDWAAASGDVCLDWFARVVPARTWAWIGAPAHEARQREQMVVWFEVVTGQGQPLPVWLSPRWSSESRTGENGEAILEHGGDGETYSVHPRPHRRALVRRSRGPRSAWLLRTAASCAGIREVVEQLRGGGFRLGVWGWEDRVEIVFSDSADASRKGRLERPHAPRENVEFGGPPEWTGGWTLHWESVAYALVPEEAVPEVMREWGRPYVGGAAFWVRGAGPGPGPYLPELLIMTGEAAEVDLFGSVFSRRRRKEVIMLPRRTMRYRMHPGGRMPCVHLNSTGDAVHLFALCQTSCKDACLARLIWYVQTVMVLDPSPAGLGPKEAMLQDRVWGLCCGEGMGHLAHPYRHVLQQMYGATQMTPAQRREADERVRQRAMTAELLQASPLKEVTELTATPVQPQWMAAGREMEERAAYAYSDVERARDKQALDQMWERIGMRDRLRYAHTPLYRLFPPVYQADHVWALWAGKVRDARETATAEDVMSGVCPGAVPGLGEQLAMQADTVMVLFQLLQGVLVSREQADLLERMWPRRAAVPESAVFQAAMGMGKSSVLMPYLVFRGLRSPDIGQILIVQPEHLVADALRMVVGLLAGAAGYWGPGAGDWAVVLTDPRHLRLWPSHKCVCVVSDTGLKEFLLGSMVRGAEHAGANVLAEVAPCLDFDRALVLYDEIDSMYSPNRSEFNIPHADHQFHPLADVGAREEWAAAYGRAVVDMVRGRWGEEEEEKKKGGLPRRLLEKLRANQADLSANWGLNYQYGPATPGSGCLLAVPYRAVRTPMDRSSFSDIDVTALLTASMVVQEGLRAGDFDLLREDLAAGWAQARAHLAGDDGGVLLEDLFRLTVLSGDPDDADGPSLSGLLGTPSAELAASRAYSRHPRLVDYYIAGPLLRSQLRFYPRRYNMSFLDVMNIGRFGLGFSGTVNMALPGTRALTGPSEIGRIVECDGTREKIRRALGAGERFVCRSPDTEAECVACLAGMRLGLRAPHLALVDACAVWRDTTADGVYGRLADAGVWPPAPRGRAQHRFVWFDDQDRAMERVHEGPREVSRGRYVPASAVPTFYYFDQRHSRGSDLGMPGGVEALVTVDTDRSTLTDVAQAAFRLRRIGRGHRVHYLLTRGIPDPEMTLHAWLGLNEEREKVGEGQRHHVQVYKSTVRWALHGGWTRSVGAGPFEEAYLEPTPYDLHDLDLDLSAVCSEFDRDTRMSLGELLERVRRGRRAGRDEGQMGQTQVDIGREIKRQRDETSSPRACLPAGPGGGANVPLEVYTALAPEEVEVGSGSGSVVAHARRLGVVLSPLVCRTFRGRMGRYYLRGGGAGVLTILTMAEAVALPSALWDAGSVVDPHGHEHDRDRDREHDAGDRLGRLLCGAGLGIEDQYLLLREHAEDPARSRALCGVLSCFVDSGLVHLPGGHILRRLLSLEEDDDGGGRAGRALDYFQRTYLGSPEGVCRYLFGLGDDGRVRQKVLARMAPMWQRWGRVLGWPAPGRNKKRGRRGGEREKSRTDPEPVLDLGGPEFEDGRTVGVADFAGTGDLLASWARALAGRPGMRAVDMVVAAKRARRSGSEEVLPFRLLAVTPGPLAVVVRFAATMETGDKRSVLQQAVDRGATMIVLFVEDRRTRPTLADVRRILGDRFRSGPVHAGAYSCLPVSPADPLEKYRLQ